MTRVLVQADGAMRAELEATLEDASIVGVGSDNHHSLAERVETLAPDVVVIEAHGDEAIAALVPARDVRTWPPVMLVVEHADPAWTAAALRAGIRAVVTRGSADLGPALAATAAGFVVVHPDATESLVPAINRIAPRNGREALTQREVEVLHMMAEGLANKTIASRLGISEHTVKFHVGSIFNKLHATSRTEAVALGARQGLVML